MYLQTVEDIFYICAKNLSVKKVGVGNDLALFMGKVAPRSWLPALPPLITIIMSAHPEISDESSRKWIGAVQDEWSMYS